MIKNKIISIIPARGGSKGIPRKNLKLLNGKPLIYYTIRESLKSKYICRTLVSTEDDEIAKISNEYNAEVIKRPLELSKDETLSIDVVFNVLDNLKINNFKPDIIVLLQPTSPLRNYQDIDKSIELFIESNCETLVSVCEMEHTPYWILKVEGKYLKPIFGDKYLTNRRQELTKLYRPNGGVYISTIENIYKCKSFYGNKTVPYIMPLERSIDIDNEIDFSLAELLIKKF